MIYHLYIFRPFATGSNPNMIFSKVDLPAPLGPTIAKNSPLFMCILIFSKTCLLSN